MGMVALADGATMWYNIPWRARIEYRLASVVLYDADRAPARGDSLACPPSSARPQGPGPRSV